MNKEKQIDLSKALIDPGSVFESPEELRDCPSLTIEQKIEILRRWTYDASELAVAEEEEGMTGGELSIIDRVLSVLNILAGGYDVEHSPPTKQKGI